MQLLKLTSHDHSVYLVTSVGHLLKVSAESKQNVSYELLNILGH